MAIWIDLYVYVYARDSYLMNGFVYSVNTESVRTLDDVIIVIIWGDIPYTIAKKLIQQWIYQTLILFSI